MSPSPAPVADAVAEARRLTGQSGPANGEESDHSSGDEAVAVDGSGTPAEQAPENSESSAGDGAEPPSRSAVRSLRPRPKQTKRADANLCRGEAYAAVSPSPDKMNIHKAKKEPDWPKFHLAVQEEVESLWKNGTWVLVDLPEGKTVTGTQMLCERKRGADGAVSRYKGRYVARGDTQVYKVDYSEVWAPVARHTTLRVVLAACARNGWELCQLDVETAFLNGDVEEEVYVRQPVGYERGDRSKVCRLRKALYGLKQASRAWYLKLVSVLVDAGMRATAADPCLFTGTFEGMAIFVLVYVDDLLVTGPTAGAVAACKRALTEAFVVRDIGEPTYFLGMHVTRDKGAGLLTLGQRQYVTKVLERFKMAECNPVRLPMGVGVVLQKDGTPLDDEMSVKYQEVVGSLLYLATCTRPDISFAVGKLSRYVSAPTQAHWAAAKAVMRYLQGTRDWALKYGDVGPLVGYSDADFAGDQDTRRSTTGQAFLWGGATVSWGSKIQATVAASTTEAEYVAAGMAAREALWLRNLVGEITGEEAELRMHCDSQGALALMRNPMTSNRTKHIDVTHHFVRECVESGAITVVGVGTRDMTADCLTKPLATEAFNKCREALGLVDLTQAASRVGVLAPGESHPPRGGSRPPSGGAGGGSSMSTPPPEPPTWERGATPAATATTGASGAAVAGSPRP